MKSPNSSRPLAIIMISIIASVIGLGAVFGGTALIVDPTGDTLGVSASFLNGLPVSDYELVGAFLLTLGLVTVAGVLALWRNLSWGWPLTLAMALVTGVWTLLGFALLGLQFSHQPLLLLAVVWELYLLWRPSSLSYTLS